MYIGFHYRFTGTGQNTVEVLGEGGACLLYNFEKMLDKRKYIIRDQVSTQR